MPKFEGYSKKDMATSEPVPEATYRLRVKGVEFADPDNPVWKAAHPNSEAKHPGLNVDFVVQDEQVLGPNNEEVVVLGRHIFSNFTMKKGGDFMLRQLLDAINYPDDEDLDTDKLVDAEVLAVVTIQPKTEKYEARNNIKRIMSAF